MLIVGALGVILFFITRSQGAPASGIYMFFPLLMALFHFGFCPVIIYADHIEFKTTPIKGVNYIEYSMVSCIEKYDEKTLYIYVEDKKLKLSLKLINREDRDELEDFLQKKIEI
jgi:hypothetical protein